MHGPQVSDDRRGTGVFTPVQHVEGVESLSEAAALQEASLSRSTRLAFTAS